MEKVLFKDIPVSKKKLKGSLETFGKIDYHYQKYDNTFKFLSNSTTPYLSGSET